MTIYEFEIKDLEYYIKKCDTEDDYNFQRRSENYIKEIDILKIKNDNKTVLKISYFNKCNGNKNGFYITEYNDDKKINGNVNKLYFDNDCKIRILIKGNILRMFVITKYNDMSSSFEQNLFVNVNNSIIKFGNEIIENGVKFNINGKECESEIKYNYIGHIRSNIFEDEEVESYYNYCCNGQGD
jgi:hypothetical protein